MAGTSQSDGGGRSGPLPAPQFFCLTPTLWAIFPSPQSPTGSGMITLSLPKLRLHCRLQNVPKWYSIFLISTFSMYFILSLLMTIDRAIYGSESSDNKRQLKTTSLLLSAQVEHGIDNQQSLFRSRKGFNELGSDAKKDKWKNWGRGGNYTNKYF